MTWGPFSGFFAFWSMFFAQTLGRSSEVEHNAKMNISFFGLERGGGWGSSPLISLADHQNLKESKNEHFNFLAGEGWWMGFESMHPYPIEIEIHQFPVQA